MTVLHFHVVFPSISAQNFYPQDPNKEFEEIRDQLDSQFGEQVVEELAEECEIREVYSESTRPPYAVFEAKFERTNTQLYERFGPKGMGEIVGEVAEDVYGHETGRTTMEGRPDI